MKSLTWLLTLMIVCCGSVYTTRADYITGGLATLTIDEGKANSISAFNAYFDELATRSEVLSLPAPGNKAFIRNSATQVLLTDPIRPYGVSVANGIPGNSRSPQATTLEIENLNNVLGSWTTSNDAFGFVGNSQVGEQIAFTSMQRWTGPFTGSLVYGDFALRNTGSKLVLTSNIDFLSAAFADIGNPIIQVSGGQMTINGDLLIGGGLTILDASAPLGSKFGTFSMTATISAVPEPSSMITVLMAMLGLTHFRRRR